VLRGRIRIHCKVVGRKKKDLELVFNSGESIEMGKRTEGKKSMFLEGGKEGQRATLGMS